MKTPIKPDHLQNLPSAPLGLVAAGATFYLEDDRDLWMATATTQNFYVQGPPFGVNVEKQERECVRLRDGRTKFLDVQLSVQPVHHAATPVW